MMLVGLTALSVVIMTKCVAPMPVGGVGDGLRAEDVVLDGLAGIELHQRHVLVGGGVDDDLGLVLLEDRLDARPVGDVADQRLGRHRPGTAGAGPVRCRTGGSPPAPRAAAASGSKWQIWRHISEPMEPPAPVTRMILSRAKASDQIEVELDDLAAEQVVDVDVADLGDAQLAGGDVRDGGDRAEPDLGALADLDDPAQLLAGGRGHGDGDLLDVAILADLGQLLDTVPSTGMPWMLMPCLTGSSSMKPIARTGRPACGGSPGAGPLRRCRRRRSGTASAGGSRWCGIPRGRGG